MPPKFVENIVILCFESFFSKQNSVIRLKSNISPTPVVGSPQIFGLATPLRQGMFSTAVSATGSAARGLP